MNYGTLFDRLHDEGLIASREVPSVEDADLSPWYMRVMLGFAGWLAGLFLVGFLGGLFTLVVREGPAMIVLGFLLCGAAAAIYWWRQGVVVPQIALAISMAGQVFFLFGLHKLMSNQDTTIALLLAAFQAALVVVMRNFLHRLLSTIFAAAALYYALYKLNALGVGAGALALGFAALWILETRWRATRWTDAVSAVALGLGIALTVWTAPMLVVHAFGKAPPFRGFEGLGYGAGLLAFVLAATRHATLRTRALAVVGAALLIAATYRAPGVIACTLVMLAAYGGGQRALAAWAVFGLIGYLGFFYYQLEQTLLAKSITLAGSGAALLVARWIMARLFKEDRRE